MDYFREFRVCERNFYWIIHIILMRIIGGCFCERGIRHTCRLMFHLLISRSSWMRQVNEQWIVDWGWLTRSNQPCVNYEKCPTMLRYRSLHLAHNRLLLSRIRSRHIDCLLQINHPTSWNIYRHTLQLLQLFKGWVQLQGTWHVHMQLCIQRKL